MHFEEEIIVTPDPTASAPVLSLRDRSGAAPRVLTFTVGTCGTGETTWVLVAEKLPSPLPFYIVNPVTGKAIDVPGPDEAGGCIEPPRAGSAAVDECAEPLGGVVYGVVPAGFRQLLPLGGPPGPLSAGSEILLVVMGVAGATGAFLLRP
jgi:hypothetical protein